MLFFYYLVPYRNFVTSVDQNYKPTFFVDTKQINKLLQKNILINQSQTTLTDGAIEILSLGLNFIPSNSDMEQETEMAVTRLTHDINKQLLLHNRKTNGNRGWLSKFVKSDWTPEEQTWTSDKRIIPIMDRLHNPIKVTNPILHNEAIQTLKTLQTRSDVHILKADKGRNTVIWGTTDYDREATRQLADTSTYKELSKEEYQSTLKNIKSDCCLVAENLLALNHISPQEDEAIIQSKPEGSYIYFLPKIHKDIQHVSRTFPGRPIVATFSSVTNLLDKYITEITCHLLPLIPGSLIDTQDFINNLPQTPLTASTVLTTADVTSLYPNIPWKEGIDASTDFYKNNLAALKILAKDRKMRQPPQPNLFRIILELVLTNSMISFKDRRFFKQIKGTAMGCCISVYFANCYMFSITNNLIKHKPTWLISFLRFIDDLFFITNINNRSEINTLIKSISNEHIRYEVSEPARMQNFLDCTITLNNKNIIVFAPFSKETASGAYLHPASTHPEHTITASPYSQFLRIRRISSNKYIFKKHAGPMKTNFINMGYPKGMIQRIYNKVSKITKADLFTKKENEYTTQNSLKFITKFNFTNDWKKTNKDLLTLHKAIITHYEEEGPNKNVSFVSMLNETPIKLVTGNKPNINSFFSSRIKTGKTIRK